MRARKLKGINRARRTVSRLRNLLPNLSAELCEMDASEGEHCIWRKKSQDASISSIHLVCDVLIPSSLTRNTVMRKVCNLIMIIIMCFLFFMSTNLNALI